VAWVVFFSFQRPVKHAELKFGVPRRSRKHANLKVGAHRKRSELKFDVSGSRELSIPRPIAYVFYQARLYWVVFDITLCSFEVGFSSHIPVVVLS